MSATPGRTGSRVTAARHRELLRFCASFSTRAASLGDPNRSHHAANSGVGPVHSQSSTRADVGVGAQRGEHLETVGDVAPGRERRRQPIHAAHAGDVPFGGRRRGSLRDGRSRSRTAAAVLAPNPGSPGNPSAESPTSASQSGMDAGATPNFACTPSASIRMSRAAVELHDLAADALPEILVGRADDHLLDPRGRRPRPRRRSRARRRLRGRPSPTPRRRAR